MFLLYSYILHVRTSKFMIAHHIHLSEVDFLHHMQDVIELVGCVASKSLITSKLLTVFIV